MYFHGRPCKYGHTLRRISDRHCVACNSKRNRDWQRANPEKANARNRSWRKNNPEKYSEQSKAKYTRHKAADLRRFMLSWAKRRAKVAGLLCTITLDDIVIPERCPLLGVPLAVSTRRMGPASPSLDRILNDQGYVPGNVVVVSYQANARKGELCAAELRKLADNLAKLELDARAGCVGSNISPTCSCTAL